MASRRSNLPVQVPQFQEPMQLDGLGPGIGNELDESDEEPEIVSSQGVGRDDVGGREAIAISNESSNGSFPKGFNVENPTFDLEVLANSYSGLTKINRLLFIADHCSTLRIEALKIAIAYVKEATYNTTLYTKIYEKLADAIREVGSTPEAVIGGIDTTWIEQRSKKAQLKLEKLDGDLKNYKSNSIKESIRRGHDDLGDHYLDMGDLPNALKCYARSRDYCTSGKHVLNMCLNVIKVGIHLQNWIHVVTYVAKAEATPEHVATGPVGTKLACAAGLSDLATGKFKRAADHFLNANFEHFHVPECLSHGISSHGIPISSPSFTDFLSPNNVAVYGGLTALATFDRKDLYKKVISSSSFKLFLELEPQLREALTLFYNSKYAKCLSILESIKDNLLLDVYLHRHVNDLYRNIRQKAIVQYFSPYSSADMKQMATSFNTSVNALEDEVMHLILDGQIQARIDSHNKILYSKDVDQRKATFEKALEMGNTWNRRTKALILRAAMLRHGNIQVRPPPGPTGRDADAGIGSHNNHINNSGLPRIE